MWVKIANFEYNNNLLVPLKASSIFEDGGDYGNVCIAHAAPQCPRGPVGW